MIGGASPLITTERLRLALERAFEPRLVVDLERRPSPYRTSHALEELNVTFVDGETVALVLKDLSRDALHEDALRVRPHFLYDPLREVEVYRSVLPDAGLGTATCYAAVASVDEAWLLLERVQGIELYQAELDGWERAAAWLARVHAQLKSGGDSPHLLRYDESYYRLWLDRAAELTEGLESIAGVYEDATQKLLDLPSTVVHGEFYASNVLVGSNRLCAVDWELAGVAPGVIDLAALSSGRWDERDRMRIALAYHAAVDDAPPLERFLNALDCARLHLALRWLGWCAEWTPPREHAQDWRTEALAAAGRLT